MGHLCEKTVVLGNARFSVITENLIRCEWMTRGVFCDAGTLFAVNRAYNGCIVDIKITENVVEIKTEAIHLYYKNNGAKGFTAENLHAEIYGEEWHYGKKNVKNLGGTLATLDGVEGYCKVDDGLLSRDGWFVIDDSKNAMIENGWLKKSIIRREPDLYLFGYGNDYKKALQTLFYVSGKAALPRKYTFGSWYSRWWAYTDEEILGIVDEYDANDFPLDIMVIDMDWHHHDWTYRGTEECKLRRATSGYGHAGNLGWTGYSWNHRLIKNPPEMLKKLHEKGIAVTLNDHPHDGVRTHEVMYANFMRSMGLPTECGIELEFDAGDERYMQALYRNVHDTIEKDGVDFWWVDWQQDHLKPYIKGTYIRHLPWLNYCYYHHAEKDGKRGISFSRWGGFGDHKHPIYFSGDTKADWEVLSFEVEFTASSSNAGLFYWGHDTGGFFGEPNAELYVRWTQFSGFSACLRAHSERNAVLDRRPWKWGERETDAMRKIYHLRSQLMPYIYSLAYDGYENGMPMIASMYLEYPDDENAYHNPQEYLFGPAFICAPVTSPMNDGKAKQTLWLPENDYYHFFTGKKYEAGYHEIASALDEFPLFVKGGVPIPMQAYTNRMTKASPEELVIRIYPGEKGSFTLYEDDGISRAYENGEFLGTQLSYTNENGIITIKIKPFGNGYEGMPTMRSYRIELMHTEEKLSVLNDIQADVIFNGDLNVVQIPKTDSKKSMEIMLKSRSLS
ncbi:MAG: DUF5110 domain-containing protein [Clostridia bacterium]|nr:DUF5110 domain-containing protein [Clostridia bacterium]